MRQGETDRRSESSGGTSEGQTGPKTELEQQMNELHRLTLTWTRQLEKSRIAEYTQLLNRPWRLIWLNLLSGTARGVGIAIGFTFFAATIIYLLQLLGALNLPIIGDYIADVVRIVQRQLELNTY
ncbi:hypothetical protein J41TS12_40390 [Paenibacillus antibioticophila]|uniref:Uncharacterized protein n=1 Tax=Paenibacillus antibioticophila TaxID=1274374 RepID=A0A920CIX4_9BACL|nr:DUF5665 domain-containing protein [Paenibacillus antibioticophila]GIO39178.1 hypothetical protein J41TS12_40390 [Paenibacillus antibioticophila]